MPKKLTRERLEEIKRSGSIGVGEFNDLISHAEATIEQTPPSIEDGTQEWRFDSHGKLYLHSVTYGPSKSQDSDIRAELREINANLRELQTVVRQS